MGLFNKLCKYVENEPGLWGGYCCRVTGLHLDQSSDLFKDYCDSYGNCVKCPFYLG